MNLILSFPFAINNEGFFSERYPDLRTGYITIPFNIESNNYSIKIFTNFYMENIEISILNINGDYIISNIPFNTSKNTNYLIGDISFRNHKLIYNFQRKQFELYKI